MRTLWIWIAAAALTPLGAVTTQARPRGGAVAGEISVTVDGKPKKDRSGVVVYLEDVPVDAVPPAKPAAIRQRNKQFDPPLSVVVRGTTVEFPNDDKIFHNVFSVSRAARFDLGLYKSGTSKSVEMKRPGTVDVYCNIHPEMVARVKVLDNAFYDITDAQGKFRIDGVPPGTYPAVAWISSGVEQRGEVTVKAGGIAEFRAQLAEVSKREHHLRKDGTPYGRYK
jgi:plastocyanin